MKFSWESVVGIVFLVIIIAIVVLVIRGAEYVEPSEEICDLIDNDLDGEIDEGFSVTCTKDSDCGPTGTYGETYCKDGNVWQSGYESVCEGKPGTCETKCSGQQIEKLIRKCPSECSRGQCI